MAPKWSPITHQCEFTKLLSTLIDSRIKCLLFVFQAVNQQTLHSEYGGWQWRRILHSKNWNFTGRLRQGNYHKFPVGLRHLARPHFKKPNKIIRWSRSEILVGKTGNLNTEMSRCQQRPLAQSEAGKDGKRAAWCVLRCLVFGAVRECHTCRRCISVVTHSLSPKRYLLVFKCWWGWKEMATLTHC